MDLYESKRFNSKKIKNLKTVSRRVKVLDPHRLKPLFTSSLSKNINPSESTKICAKSIKYYQKTKTQLSETVKENIRSALIHDSSVKTDYGFVFRRRRRRIWCKFGWFLGAGSPEKMKLPANHLGFRRGFINSGEEV